MKIVIEGMDGVGKSTVCHRLAEELKFKYVDGILHSFFKDLGYKNSEIKDLDFSISQFAELDNSIIRTWFFGFANIFNLLYYDENLIIDRHCLTTYFWNADENSKHIYRFMQELTGKPDLVIILFASPEVRYKRLYGRNKNDADLQDVRKMTYGYDKFIEGASYLGLNYSVINTDELSEDEVYIATKACVDNYINKKKEE